SFIERQLVLIGPAQIKLEIGPLGLQLNRPSKAIDGFCDSLLLQQNVAQVRMHVGERGIERKRRVRTFHRLVQSSLTLECQCQVAMSIRRIRCELNGSVAAIQRNLVIAMAQRNSSEKIPSVCRVGISRYDLPTDLFRLIMPARLMMAERRGH